MRLMVRRSMLLTACATWVLIIGAGLALLWNYENTAAPPSAPPAQWPVESSIHPATDRATLIMLAHPHCPCTRASIGELAKLMAHSQGRVTAYALFVKAPDSSEDWEKTDLWRSAADIPGVNVVVDDGVEAERFHADTSGETVLYDAEGRLLFSGGITSSRGHSGDNLGSSAILSLLNRGEAEQTQTSVFGCPLFSTQSQCRGSSNDRDEH